MIQTSYISTASEPMSNEALLGLLKECRESNAGNGITGMLLYGNGTFLQVLEGEDRAVDALVERIRQDDRHTDLHVLYRTPIERRQYPDWSMGFKRISGNALSKVEGLVGFGEKDFTPGNLLGNDRLVQSLMDHFRKERFKSIGQGELGVHEDDRLINVLHRIIRGAVRVLAVLMVLTILWGVVDAAAVLYQGVLMPSFEELRAREIVVTFGSFLAVLIAIEIFMNITLYLREDVVHVKLVIATALMAIARKVIVFDFEKIAPLYVLSTAAVVLALGVVYVLMDPRTTWGHGNRQP